MKVKTHDTEVQLTNQNHFQKRALVRQDVMRGERWCAAKLPETSTTGSELLFVVHNHVCS